MVRNMEVSYMQVLTTSAFVQSITIRWGFKCIQYEVSYLRINEMFG